MGLCFVSYGWAVVIRTKNSNLFVSQNTIFDESSFLIIDSR